MPHGLKQCGYCLELGTSVNILDEETAKEFDPKELDVDSIFAESFVNTTQAEADILDQNQKGPAIHTVKHARTKSECVQEARIVIKEARVKKNWI